MIRALLRRLVPLGTLLTLLLVPAAAADAQAGARTDTRTARDADQRVWPDEGPRSWACLLYTSPSPRD